MTRAYERAVAASPHDDELRRRLATHLLLHHPHRDADGHALLADHARVRPGQSPWWLPHRVLSLPWSWLTNPRCASTAAQDRLARIHTFTLWHCQEDCARPAADLEPGLQALLDRLPALERLELCELDWLETRAGSVGRLLSELHRPLAALEIVATPKLPLTGAMLEALTRTWTGPGPITLRLDNVRLTHRAVGRALSSPALRALEALVVVDGELDMRALAQWRAHPAALRHLELRRVRWSTRGLAETLMGGALDRLELLTLESVRLDDEGLSRLLRWVRRSPITSLSLAGNELVDSEELASLLIAVGDRLEDLDLSENNLLDTVVETLTSRATCGALRTLNLSHNLIGDDGAARLAAAPWLPGLEQLEMHGNALSNEGWQTLIRAPHINPVLAVHLRQQWRDESGSSST